MTSSLSTASVASTTEISTLPPFNKPSLPKRSHRRSLVGEQRPQLVLDTPPLPASPTLQHAPAASMTTSSSLKTFPTACDNSVKQQTRVKRASTGAVPFASSLPSVAPLKIGSKRGARPVSSILSSPSASLSNNSPMATPTMPAKSRFRNSLSSPVSSVDAQASWRSATSSSEFDRGIGLDFGSPGPNLPTYSSCLSNLDEHDAVSAPASHLERNTSASNTSTHAPSAPAFSKSTRIDQALDEQWDTSPSSVASTIPDRSDLVMPVHAKSHDAVFSRNSMATLAEMPKRASLLSAVPMGLSLSHQEMINSSPKTFHRNEAEGLFDSVRGLMADLRFEVGTGQTTNFDKQAVETDKEDDDCQPDLRSWLATPKRSQEDTAQSEKKESNTLECEGEISMPSIKIAEVSSGSDMTYSDSTVSSSKPVQQQKLAPPEPSQSDNATDANGAASPRTRGLWGLLRAPSPSKSNEMATRSPSVSSYSSNSSFIPRSSSPAAPNNASTSSLLSNSGFSLFSRKLLTRSVSDTQASATTQDDDVPLRLSRRQVDEDKLADLIISCADARHVLKTDTSPAKLREVGLKLELGWREQLAEAQQLRSRLEITQDTVEDLEDENKQLRSQLGTLSEQIVSREDDIRALGEATTRQIEREREAVSVELDVVQTEAACEVKRLERLVREEESFALGLGLLLQAQERSKRNGNEQDEASIAGGEDTVLHYAGLGVPPWSAIGQDSTPLSVLFDLSSDTEEAVNRTRIDQSASLRRSALLQARRSSSDLPGESLDLAYEELFRCPAHRFPHGSAAPPSTLVDERILLIGTDARLLVALVQKLGVMGLTQIVIATPEWSSASSPQLHSLGIRSFSFDATTSDAWKKLLNLARKELGGEVDCVVNAFDKIDTCQLGTVSFLLKEQVSHSAGKGQVPGALSIVNVVYSSFLSNAEEKDLEQDGDNESVCALALIGLASDLAARCSRMLCTTARLVRLNTLLLAASNISRIDATSEAILRLIDPCCTTQGCILQPHPQPRCLGPPLCPALPAFFSSPTFSSPSTVQSAHSMGLRDRKRDNSNGQRLLTTYKKIADVELLDALEGENQALRERIEALERSNAILRENQKATSGNDVL